MVAKLPWPRRAGDFLFRYRSFTPVPLALILVWQADISYPQLLPGLILMFIGEIIRLVAVRAAGKSTRTRKVGARELVSWGLYSHTRNPLYIGNLLLWVGAVWMAGGAYQSYLYGLILLFFAIQYALIIALEEGKLLELFGEEYQAYCAGVPRIIPRWKSFTGGTVQLHKWGYVLESERSSIMVLAAIIGLSALSTWLKGS